MVSVRRNFRDIVIRHIKDFATIARSHDIANGVTGNPGLLTKFAKQLFGGAAVVKASARLNQNKLLYTS